MAVEQEIIDRLLANPDVGFECVQIAPMGGNRCSVLFMISDADYLDTVSMVFTLQDFSAESADLVWQTDDWLMSLTYASQRDLSALEATIWVRDRRGGEWGSERVCDLDMNRMWTAPDGRQFLVGDSGFSMVRNEGAGWTALSTDGTHELFDIHGNAQDGIYCCGARGTLQRLEGGEWVPIEIHGDYWLRGLNVGNDGVIRLAGREGTCLEVRNGDEVVVLDAPKSEFFSVCEYRGEYYWGNEFGVYIQDGNSVVPFFDTRFAFDLRTDGNYLYCVGTNAAWRFDGKDWKSARLDYQDLGGFRLV